MKQFFTALKKDSTLKYLQDFFPKLSGAKVKAGVFIGPQVRRVSVQSFQMGCKMSLKVHILDAHLDNFKESMGAYSEEQGE